jgi:hypothetical protein
LTENGYLRLDPYVILHPIYEAGLYLAKQGKEECLICIAGLKQYSIPFPSVWALAEEVEVIYTSHITANKNRATPFVLPAAPGTTQPSDYPASVPLGHVGVSSNGNAGSMWSDGSPAPSKDIAWNLFDWVHQM